MKSSQPPASSAPPRPKRRTGPSANYKQSPTRTNQYDDGYYDRGNIGNGSQVYHEDYQDEVVDIMTQTPETTIGEHVSMNGNLKFMELLRIDGEFEGKFDLSNTDGPPSLIVGRQGHLKADVEGMQTMVVDGGVVHGNISVSNLKLLGTAAVHGNITCKSLVVEEQATIVGQLNINPHAPGKIDKNGKPLPESEPKQSEEKAEENEEAGSKNDDSAE